MILRSLGLALLIFGCPITLNAQIVEFQDSLFRVELFSNQIDTNNDGQFQQEEVDQVKSLNLTGGITDTIGLAQLVEFKNLERLTVLRVTGSGLRIEDLPKLKELYISEYIGVLDSIDFGKLPAIEKINLREMESLQGITFNSDNIKVLEFNLLNCPKLKKVGLFHCKRLYSLIIDSPNLEFLTIPKSPNLYLLEVLNASIKKLDIQNCPMIDGLDFYKFNIDLDTLILKHIGINYITIRVPIKHIEMSNMDNLQSILIDSLNSFEELTLADFPALRTLNLDGLELKNLSLTNLPVLSDIFASNNKLESINLSGMELMRVDLSNNVLTEFRANNTKISDLNISHNNFTTLTEFKDLEIRDFDFRGNPTSLPNLEEFTSLSEIYMGNNGFDSLLNAEAFNVHTIFIGPDTTIKYIEVGQERLRDLFVFECGNLTRLDADNDGLRKIYVRDCPKFNSLNVEYLFWELIIQNTALEDVDLSNIIAQIITLDNNPINNIIYPPNNLNLVNFNFTNNRIEFDSFIIENFYLLGNLDLSNTKINHFIADSLIFLNELKIENAGLKTIRFNHLSTRLDDLDLSNNELQYFQFVSENSFNKLDLENNLLDSARIEVSRIGDLNIRRNKLSKLTLISPHLNASPTIKLDSNRLTEIDLSSFEYIRHLDLSNNLFEHLEVKDAQINEFFARNNKLRTVDIKDGKPNRVFLEGNEDLLVVCVDDFEKDWMEDHLAAQGKEYVAVNGYCSFELFENFQFVTSQTYYVEDSTLCNSKTGLVTNGKYRVKEDFQNDREFFGTPMRVALDAGTYKINPQLEHPEYFDVYPPFKEITIPNDDLDTINFCVVGKSEKRDLAVRILPLGEARPGFDANYKLIYENKAIGFRAGSITLEFQEDIMDFVSASIPPDLVEQGQLTWNYSDLRTLESRSIEFTMEVNSPMDEPPLVGDEELCFIAEIPFEGDFVPEDNIFSLKQQVVNSFDPNDKTCLQGNTMHPDMIGSYVDYLIRFENVGTANAVNIVIKDKINPVIFDISTLYITDASHQPMETEIKGNSVEFIFKDIQLPFDDANNDGFVAFKIKTHDHLSLGDTLSNKAEIYFDFNYPIITNDANTVFQVKVSNNDLDPLEEKLSVYPNPTRNNLSVEVESTIEQLSLFDIAGKMHLTWKDVQSQKFKQALNISPGVYVLQITTSTGHYFKKIVVQKE